MSCALSLTPFSVIFQAKDLNFEIEKLEIQINNLNIDRYFVCCGCGLCDALASLGLLAHTRFDRRWCCYRVLRAFLREEVAEAKLYTVKLQVFSRLSSFAVLSSYRVACVCKGVSRCLRMPYHIAYLCEGNANACLYRRYWT